MYWASGLHLYTPLPFRPGRDGYGDLFKTHVFVTAGNVGNFGLTGDLQRDLDQVSSRTSPLHCLSHSCIVSFTPFFGIIFMHFCTPAPSLSP